MCVNNNKYNMLVTKTVTIINQPSVNNCDKKDGSLMFVHSN